MKYIIISFTFMLARLSSCSYVSKIADAAIGTQMDNESTYTKAAEMLGEVDPAWKVYYLRIANEGVSEKCQNTLGYISVGMMNADGDVITRTFILSKPILQSTNSHPMVQPSTEYRPLISTWKKR